MNKGVSWVLAFACLVWAFPQFSCAELWPPFSKMIDDSDHIAQYQELIRGDQVVGRRLVQVYWQAKDFKAPASLGEGKPWTREAFKPNTDRVITKFVFHGRGQHLWTVSPPANGVIFFAPERRRASQSARRSLALALSSIRSSPRRRS
jgi:hypothetical protein